MRAEEIAVRQEVRQMLSEAGINRNTLREMTQEILREEIKKQIKIVSRGIDVNKAVRHELESYEGKSALRDAIKKEVRDRISINVDVTAFGRLIKDKTTKELREDTMYSLKDGEFVEVCEHNE